MHFKELSDFFYKIPSVDLSNTFEINEKINNNNTVDMVYNWNISCGIVDIDDIPDSNKEYYVVKNNDHLKLISYSLYNTIDFWWLIAKINKIDDVLAPLKIGRKLVVFSTEVMCAIYSEILKLSNQVKMD